jgi:cell division protein FtsA
MGGGTTSLSIFMKKHMIYADTVRLGGDHVTRDISMGLTGAHRHRPSVLKHAVVV